MRMNNNRKKYDSNPLLFLYVAYQGLMSEILWKIWLGLIVILILLNLFGVIDSTKIKIGDTIDASIAGLSFTLIVVSAALEIFSRKELIRLYNTKNIGDSEDGQLLMQVLAPYVFTSMIFLLLGILSVVAPTVIIQISTFWKGVIKFIYMAFFILGMFSLFNICYDIVINIFNSVRREVIGKQNNKKGQGNKKKRKK